MNRRKKKLITGVVVISVVGLLTVLGVVVLGILYSSNKAPVGNVPGFDSVPMYNQSYNEDESTTMSAVMPSNVRNDGMKSEAVLEDEGYKENSRETTDDTNSWADDRKIIKNGSIVMVVEDLDEALAEVQQIKTTLNGYVENLSDNGVDNSRTVYITIKVPVAQFDSAMEQIKNVGDEVQRSNVTTDDVSAQYTDLESQLRNLEATEEQMLTIMKRATKISDILDVQNELNTVRGNIEQIKGQLKYFDRHTQYSSITVTMSLVPENISLQEEKWRPVAVIKDAFGAFVGILEATFEVLVWLVMFSPFVLVPVFLVKLGIKRKSKKG